MDKYPTEEQLRRIKGWDIQKEGVRELVDYITDIWWMPDWGFRLHKGRSRLFHKPVMKLQLHTGGWSGNEDIIGELQSNFFWLLFWERSIRGGHYYFEIDMSHWKK